MYCDNCGDVCELVTDVRTLNALTAGVSNQLVYVENFFEELKAKVGN